jgi:indolepyruvate ferredoxin oxidoreductase
LVVTASSEALSKMSPARTRVAVNATTAPTADFVRNPNWQLPGGDLLQVIKEACGADNVAFVPAAELATNLMGDSIATNMFMLGYCWQKGWVPLERTSIERAIELNGVQVEFNLGSFLWGRRAAVDPERVQRVATPAEVIPIERHFSRTLDELIERRMAHLTGYQNAAYAARYKALVDRVRIAEQERIGATKLTEAVARYYAKLLAYKDEYEVARLHVAPVFLNSIGERFEGDYRLVYHLAPPLLAKADPLTGEPRKMQFGQWMLTAMRVLARLKGLRGGALDIFGYTEERRTERALIVQYEQMVESLLKDLNRDNCALALELASLPEAIRGYGHVKAKSIAEASTRRDALLAHWPQAPASAAARAA